MACTQNENIPQVAKSKKVKVQINVTEDVNLLKPNKTVLPDLPTITGYKLMGSIDNGITYNELSSITSSGEFVPLSLGEWRFILYARDGSKEVLSDESTYTVTNVIINETTLPPFSLNFTLKTLTTGNGTFSIKLTLPAVHSVTSVETKIDDGTPFMSTIDTSTTPHTITCSGSIVPGDHIANFRLLNGTGNLLISVTELIAVYPNIETTWLDLTIDSDDMNAPPTAPTGLTALIVPSAPAAQSKVKLIWNDMSNNETGFTITNDLVPTDLTPDINAALQTITVNVARGQDFIFKIKAINDFGESLYSNVTALIHTPQLWTITYNGNTNTSGAVPVDATTYEGVSTVTIKDSGTLLKGGYSFSGWNTLPSGLGLNYLPSQNASLPENQVLYAQWTVNPVYTVTYNGDGATIQASPSTASVTLPATTVVTLPTPPLKTGYIFGGWFTAPGGVLPQFFETTTVTASLTVYAKWTPDNYTITYNLGTASLGTLPTTQTTPYNQPVTISDNTGLLTTTAQQDGMTKVFYCWNTQSDGLGTDYTPGQTFPMGSANMVLYPKFSIIGATGPAGGLVFYDKGNNTDGWRYLEADPNSTTVTKTWGKNTELVGNTLQTIGAGKKNSAYINSFMNNPTATTNTAAQYCETLTSGGKSDWFFPSKSEMIEMNTQLHKRGLGNFSGITYWTSSEFSASAPFYITWSTGGPWSNNNKLPALTVRPARAFRSTNETFVVVYHANESTSGTAPVDNNHYESSDLVTIANNTGILAKTGLNFTGWNTANDGSGTHYNAGQTSVTLPDNLVLYSEWTPSFTGGDGTAGNPFFITNLLELKNIKYLLNKYFILKNDIDLISETNWVPLGNATKKFTGGFDGDNFPLKNLRRTITISDFGLFGSTDGAILKNIKLTDIDIKGADNVGALVGNNPNSTSITNCSVTGKMLVGQSSGGLVGSNEGTSGLTISKCWTNIEIETSAYGSIGGILGRNYNGTISINESFSVGNLNTIAHKEVDHVGGLVGFSAGTGGINISNCYSTGDVYSKNNAGGLIGNFGTGTVNNSYSTGAVSSSTASKGGLIGISGGGTVTNSFYDKDTAGLTAGAGSAKTTAEMTTQSTFTGWDFVTTPVWKIDTGSYPYFPWQGALNIPKPPLMPPPANLVSLPASSGFIQQEISISFTHNISAFQIAKYETSYEQWYVVFQWAINNGYSFVNQGQEGNDGSAGSPPTIDKLEPVTMVNWRDAIVWCNAYSEMSGLTPVYYSDVAKTTPIKVSLSLTSINTTAGSYDNPYVDWTANGYRLPTEGEWQYAAGFVTASSWNPWNAASGDTTDINVSSNFENYMWWNSNSSGKTQNVVSKTQNGAGLFNMSGNVNEWCYDWYDTATTTTKTDYQGPLSTKAYRIARGGGYNGSDKAYFRIGMRSYIYPYEAWNDTGFRVAKNP